MSATGWYGPLIDLSSAASHINGGFVQLLVFVHRCRSSHNSKYSIENSFHSVNLSVGDETLSNFPTSTCAKHLRNAIDPGTVVLFENIKLEKHKDVTQIIVSEISSIRVLAGRHEMMGGDYDSSSCPLGSIIKDKLKRVVEWVRETQLRVLDMQRDVPRKGFPVKNWLSQEQDSQNNCLSISQLQSMDSGRATFHASIGEILLGQGVKPKRSIRETLCLPAGNIMDDLICLGCKMCGFPLVQSFTDHRTAFYCRKSSDHVHVSGSIYKPFLLCVTDQHDQLPILVKNKAAEVLFGDITAESIVRSLDMKKADQICRQHLLGSESNSSHPNDFKDSEVAESRWGPEKSLNKQGNHDFYNIWLVLLKSLVSVDKNSPFRFEVVINSKNDHPDGKFELVSFTMPCVNDGF